MADGFDYDVFLSYNSANRAEVERVAARLRDEHGLRVFFDTWEIVAGDLVLGVLEAAIDRSRTVAVFLGREGLGPWQDEERQVGFAYALKQKQRVIPALLPGAVEDAVPGFLAARAWVELGKDDGLARMVVGITRQRRTAATRTGPCCPSKVAR
ncbi:MAG: toll/interleukin-1 receptor domain-containing protein [Myxococcota bacterium]